MKLMPHTYYLTLTEESTSRFTLRIDVVRWLFIIFVPDKVNVSTFLFATHLLD